MLTAFGKFCRKLRIEHEEILKDMADKLGVTPAYLSSVEVGKRNIPAEWFNTITSIYALSVNEQQDLQEAIDSSIKQIKIDLDNYSERQRQTAAMFARKLSTLNDTELEKLFKIFGKSKTGG